MVSVSGLKYCPLGDNETNILNTGNIYYSRILKIIPLSKSKVESFKADYSTVVSKGEF